MISDSILSPETEAEKMQRFKEAVALMVGGSLISLIGTYSYKRLNAFKCFIVSAGGVVAGRGFIRFVFR